ncbi:MAG: hypothetical protein KDI11_03415, partial [Alphaproteobacteria bacterium]|nr:hypothetical protein [Alphaproteobacteria bacterium]
SDGAQKAFDGFSDTFKERAGFLVAKSNVWSKVLGSLSDVERIEKRLQLSVQMERPVGRAALFKKILEDELDVIRTLEAEDLVPISNAMRGAMVAFSGNEQAQGLVSYLFNQNPFLKELLSRDLSRVDPCMAANLAVLTR